MPGRFRHWVPRVVCHRVGDR